MIQEKDDSQRYKLVGKKVCYCYLLTLTFVLAKNVLLDKKSYSMQIVWDLSSTSVKELAMGLSKKKKM